MFKPYKRLQKWYDKYNKLYFDGKLPKAEVGLNDELEGTKPNLECYGITVSFTDDDTKTTVVQIHINPELHVTFDQARLTLLHEMVHIFLFPYDKHGKKFHDAMKTLAIKGAMDALW